MNYGAVVNDEFGEDDSRENDLVVVGDVVGLRSYLPWILLLGGCDPNLLEMASARVYRITKRELEGWGNPTYQISIASGKSFDFVVGEPVQSQIVEAWGCSLEDCSLEAFLLPRQSRMVGFKKKD